MPPESLPPLPAESPAAQLARAGSTGPAFRREMGVWSVSSYLIGAMIGTGIFVSPYGVLLYSGSPGVALIVWITCGVVANLAALCFAELGTSFPDSGSSYIYVKLAFGDFPAFLFQWVDVVLRKSTTICVRYLTFAVYFLQPFYGDCRPPADVVRVVAVVAILSLTYLNSIKSGWRSAFQMVNSATKLLAMVLIFAMGVYHMLKGDGENHLNDPFRNSITSVGSIAMAFSYGLYAYSGWDTMNTAVEEIKKPNRSLPLAIILSTVVVTCAYTMVNVAYFAVMDTADILESDAVAVVFAGKFFSAGKWVISALVCISALGATNAVVFQVSRFYYACAREGQMPKFLAGIHPQTGTPRPALLFMTLLVFVCLGAKNINQLLVYYGLLKWSMVAYPIAAQIYLRLKYPDLKRPLKLPLIIPIFTFLLLISLLIIPIYENWFNSVVALLLCFPCVPIYYIFHGWSKKPESLDQLISKIDSGLASFAQKLLLVVYPSEWTDKARDKEMIEKK